MVVFAVPSPQVKTYVKPARVAAFEGLVAEAENVAATPEWTGVGTGPIVRVGATSVTASVLLVELATPVASVTVTCTVYEPGTS
jgi:hypothetical protein